jgi:hypothetical protein
MSSDIDTAVQWEKGAGSREQGGRWVRSTQVGRERGVSERRGRWRCGEEVGRGRMGMEIEIGCAMAGKWQSVTRMVGRSKLTSS